MGPYRFALRVALYGVMTFALVAALDPLMQSSPTAFGVFVSDVPLAALERLERSSDRLLLMGDSVLFRVAEDEADKRTLSRLLEEHTGRRATILNMAAMSPQYQTGLIRALRRTDAKPWAVVVPVNLRSLSRHWQDQPRWNRRSSELMLSTGSMLPLRLLGVLGERFGRLSAEEHGRVELRVGGEPRGRLVELDRLFDREGLPVDIARTRALARYAGDIDHDRGLAGVRELLAEVAEAPWPCLVYLTPVNLEYIAAHLEPEDEKRAQANLAELRATLDASGLRWLDLSATEPASSFDHPPDSPNEHLRFEARLRVARSVAKALAQITR